MLILLPILFLLFSPRFILFLMWLFGSSRFDAFSSFWWPFLGFIFLPFTTLAYVLVWSASEGVGAIGWLIVGFGFLIDLGSHGFWSRRRRHRENKKSEPKYVENKAE